VNFSTCEESGTSRKPAIIPPDTKQDAKRDGQTQIEGELADKRAQRGAEHAVQDVLTKRMPDRFCVEQHAQYDREGIIKILAKEGEADHREDSCDDRTGESNPVEPYKGYADEADDADIDQRRADVCQLEVIRQQVRGRSQNRDAALQDITRMVEEERNRDQADSQERNKAKDDAVLTNLRQ
jgi:hypothetical protein